MQQQQLALPDHKPTLPELRRAWARVPAIRGHRPTFEQCLADEALNTALHCSVRAGSARRG